VQLFGKINTIFSVFSATEACNNQETHRVPVVLAHTAQCFTSLTALSLSLHFYDGVSCTKWTNW